MTRRSRLALALALVGAVPIHAQENSAPAATPAEEELVVATPQPAEPAPAEPDFAVPVVADETVGAADAFLGGQRFLFVAGSNFRPRTSETTFSYHGGGCLQRPTNAGDSWFTSDLQLPEGAIVDFLRVYFYDDNATFDINSELWAFNGAGGTTLIAEADSAGVTGYSSAGSNFVSHVVDNINESLVIIAGIQGGVGSSLALCGARIRYQLPNLFADDFETGDTTAWSSTVPIVPEPTSAGADPS